MNKPHIVGPTIMVPTGGNAVMTVPNPDADPHVEWLLRYSADLNSPKAGRFSAAEVVASFSYLLSNHITMTEATRRLRVMRKAVRDRRFWTRVDEVPSLPTPTIRSPEALSNSTQEKSDA